MSKKSILISLSVVGVVIVVMIVIGIYKGNSDFFNQFKSFSVMIDNQSDYDLTQIETGVMGGSQGSESEEKSKVVQEYQLASGRKVTIKPDLHLTGEGGIYLKFTDSRGETIKKTICSYTESLSGHSNVTINNDSVNVVEKCS
ncbi:hypothetical protein PALU110988_29295 [Paenibacillus lupini]|uniref:hypothetical protein n=1 Tax=Paenibacillus lupini TaxID=1450204 RepID=UPI00141E91B3|nr:hypothetical protein [Paenibacillus lupini]NIK23229.1 hypothetical protein [Paenibacillus lupini]